MPAAGLFQSTPATADGRTETGMWAGIAQELFQSTPAIADGRTAQGIKCLDNYQYVSIHARHR